jgi:putative spermidine/putrescine transport system permease protein
MTISRTARILLLCALIIGLAVIYLPMFVVILNSFNSDITFGWPPSKLTLEWWVRAASNGGALHALCSARWPRSRCSGTGSSAGSRCRCC